MILDDDDTKQLIKVIGIANSIGIESIVIDSESLRGMSDDGVFIISEHNIKQFKQTPVGISRVSILNSRFNLLKSDKIPKIELDFKERDNGEKILLRFKIKDKRTALDFKCADPTMIKNKKVLKEPLSYSFSLTEETIDLMTRTNSAMQTDKINFILDNGKIYFNISDVEGDTLKHLVSESVKIKPDIKPSFLINMKNKSILNLFKLALKGKSDVNINVSEIRNVLNFEIDFVNIYVVPEM